ncbi:hypothetical protein QJS66_07875 [Kocuria rhizophila]|nr:hypothetical protein QJS66_07875 [Kocuria rhizophila]
MSTAALPSRGACIARDRTPGPDHRCGPHGPALGPRHGPGPGTPSGR